MGILSGLLNFGLGQASAAVDFAREKKKMQIQQDNALAQMAQSQEYNKENMAIQNQYAIDAENRANAYNSPSAQIARADAAGISPLAAMGNVGNVQTISSMPSSSTPSPAGVPSGGAPRSSPVSGFHLALAKMYHAQTDYYEQLAMGKEIDNEIASSTKSLRIELMRVGLDKASAEARMAIFEDSKKAILFAKEIEERNAAINKAVAEAWSFTSAAELNEGENSRRSEQQELILLNMTEQIMLTAAQRNTELSKAENIKASTMLMGAQYLLSLSERDLKDVAKANSITEGEILATRKELEKSRAVFENAHRLEIHKQTMRNQKFSNAVNVMNGLSNVAKAAVHVYGAVVSGGSSAAVSSAIDSNSGTSAGWASNGSTTPLGSMMTGYPTTF